MTNEETETSEQLNIFNMVIKYTWHMSPDLSFIKSHI